MNDPEQMHLDAEDVIIMAGRCAQLIEEKIEVEKQIYEAQESIKQNRRRAKEIGYLIEYAMQQIAKHKMEKG